MYSNHSEPHKRGYATTSDKVFIYSTTTTNG